VTGIISGTGFGLSAVAYRAASLSLGGPNFFMQAAVTLAFAIVFQTLVMALWMALREPEQFALIRKAWKPALIVGIAGGSASLGWFSAMTLQNAGIVKALAQVEMLFTFATSVFIFREKINRAEIAGCLLIAAGIVVLMALR
jgi:drug/metabolite transporter (DMT)-like permease